MALRKFFFYSFCLAVDLYGSGTHMGNVNGQLYGIMPCLYCCYIVELDFQGWLLEAHFQD